MEFLDALPPVSKATVAGVVVLYYSPASCFDIVQTYINQVGKLYMIDNTPTGTDWVATAIVSFPSVEYIPLNDNKGIAYALNIGANRAIADGYSYLLTMDDDSLTPANLVEQIGHYWNQHLEKRIGIVSPQHSLTTATETKEQPSMHPKEILTTMSSGNLLNLKAYKVIGGFDNDLFIDVVDHEYDLNLSVNGYKIIELPSLRLIHRLGKQQQSLFGKVRFITHSPIRNYYLIRNSLIVGLRYSQHHPAYLFEAIRTVLVEIVKVVLFEDKKRSRLSYVWRALMHGFFRK